MADLTGRSALVTGAGRGFGKAIAAALARAGASVSLIARTGQEIDRAAQDIASEGGVAQPLVCDIADTHAIAAAYRRHTATFGPTSILVNCAGLAKPVGPVGVVDSAAWWRTMEVNVRASFELMTLALPDMTERGRGSIVNVASLAGLAVIPFNSAYAVSKATLIRLTEYVAAEHAQDGIAAFAVHPGIVFTRLMEEEAQSEEMKRWMPEFAGVLASMREAADREAGLKRCADHCVALAGGSYDHFSGKFLDLSRQDLADADQVRLPSFQ